MVYMKNKKHIIFIGILISVSVIIGIVSMFILPDIIPVHFGPDGSADRYGSKFEALIMPAVSLLMGIFLIVFGKISSKKDNDGKNNEKAMYITLESVLSVLVAMNLYFLYAQYNNIENLYSLKINIGSLVLVLSGLLFIITGNIMPKVKKNSVIGMRTPWTMKNDDVWKKSQRFSGFAFVIAGIIMVVCGFLVKGAAGLIILLSIIAVTIIVSLIYTYRISHETNNDNT